MILVTSLTPLTSSSTSKLNTGFSSSSRSGCLSLSSTFEARTNEPSSIVKILFISHSIAVITAGPSISLNFHN